MKASYLLLILILSLLIPTQVKAHGGITIDGDASDWANLGNGSCPSPPAPNTGMILLVTHPDCSIGAGGTEYVWADAVGDERTDFASPDTRVDIAEVRATGDPTNLHFLIRMTNIDLATGNGSPRVEIAVDTDQVTSSGTDFLGGFSDTTVDADAEWERLIGTRFGSSNFDVAVFDDGFINLRNIGVAAISTTNNVIEISVPWTEIGVSPGSTLRYTVITYRNDTSNNAFNIGGFSDVLDAVTTTGPNTFDEVSDGQVNFFFTVASNPTAVTLNRITTNQMTNQAAIITIFLLIITLLTTTICWKRHLA